jgi:hypothetical protein
VWWVAEDTAHMACLQPVSHSICMTQDGTVNLVETIHESQIGTVCYTANVAFIQELSSVLLMLPSHHNISPANLFFHLLLQHAVA